MSARGMKRREAELMQYRRPVGGGPSGKTWPRCEPANRLRTSTRTMKWLRSSCSTTKFGSTGRVKLGQPVPESYLSAEMKSGSPETMSTYSPSCLLFQNSFSKGG